MGFLFSRGRNTTNRADMIADFMINTASYGEVVPEVLGTTRLSGNIIYYDDFTPHEHRSTTRTGKGGGSKHTEITYTYTVACAIGLCEGPIQGIGKVWRGKEIYDYPNEKIELTAYLGQHGQSPWPYVISKHPEKALPYSGLAYMAGVVDLGEQGSLPQFNFEIKGKLLETGDGVDVNPADYIVHVLRSIGIDDVNIEGLDHYRHYCKAADILISTPPDSKSSKAQTVINDIAEITNSLVFWSTDRLKIVPLADKPIKDWSPYNQIQYNLTADDLIPASDGQLIVYKRKDSSETYNQATVEFINRANGYEKETVAFEVVADVQKNGLKPASKKLAHYLYTKARAQYYAEQLAMKRLYAKNQYTFHLDWAFCRLEPGDLVTLTDELCGLNNQIVVITSVSEAADGQLEITAEGKPPGTYAPAKYNVHENERPFIDYNVPAPSINDVAIIQTPGDVGGNELYIGVNSEPNWGGCSIWLSDNNENYKRIGNISQQARMGHLKTTLAQGSNLANVIINQGALKGGSHIDAERANTLCWVDGECLSYETAQLQINGDYALGGIVRGQYGTNDTAHNAGARFVRVDEALYHAPYRKEDIGKQVYFKFTSFNMYGSNEQGLDEVQAYPYKIVPYYIPEVSNLALYTKYYEIGNGVLSFDVVAQFDVPRINSLNTVELWYREQGGTWKYGGAGEGLITVSGCELGHTYDVKLQVKDTHGNASQGLIKSITVEMKSEIPNAPQGFSVSFSDMAHFNWLEVRNADVDYYEIRLDINAGQNDGLIGRSNNTTFSTLLTERTSKVYCIAHNPAKGYGAPAELMYNVPIPKQPTKVKATANISGIGVTFEPIPVICKGANVYIDDNVYYITTNIINVPLEAGVYNIKVAFVDLFGEGPKSNEQLITIKAKIDKSLLDMESLGIEGIDKAVNDLKGEVGTVKTAVNGMNNKIIDLGNAYQRTLIDYQNNVNSQITQISSGIDLKVTQAINNIDGAELVSRINLSPAGTRIDGKLLHVTGEALFDKNIITKGMIQAGSVSADKMHVDNLASISINTGDLTGGSITGGTFKNANNTFQIDPNGNIIGANITASRIDAQSIYQAGFKLQNMFTTIYKVKHGDWAPIPEGFTADQCSYVPVGCIFTEKYTAKSNNGNFNDITKTRISNLEMKQQRRRYIGECQIYSRQDKESGTNVGIVESRRAVVESKVYREWSSGNDAGNTYESTTYSYGDLFVLVIAQQ